MFVIWKLYVNLGKNNIVQVKFSVIGGGGGGTRIFRMKAVVSSK